jgi:Holliday junction resolvasome RuvABC endonuclease subunit
MKILALDLGTNTGWVIGSKPFKAQAVVGNISLKTGRYEGGGMRYLRFEEFLRETLALQGYEAVYFEEVRRHAGVDAAHVYGGLLATLTAFCERERIPYSGIPVGAWKKAALGKGNAKKDAILDWALNAGITITPPTTFDEADAVGIYYAAVHSN